MEQTLTGGIAQGLFHHRELTLAALTVSLHPLIYSLALHSHDRDGLAQEPNARLTISAAKSRG